MAAASFRAATNSRCKESFVAFWRFATLAAMRLLSAASLVTHLGQIGFEAPDERRTTRVARRPQPRALQRIAVDIVDP
jgi:hypothetical protein